MRVPISWLREYVDFTLSPAELADKLTMAGLSVEAIEDLAEPVKGIAVGRIMKLMPHPKAAKLWLAETDWGVGVRTLVTAATNLKVGDLVPVAPPDTTLPNGIAIGAREFQGVVSQGMLCSAADLGLEKQSTGIMILDGDWTLGTPIAKVLGLDETVLEIELTPNRADCLGLIGVAREVAALTGGQLHLPAAAPKASGPAVETMAEVEVADPDLCPRYGGKVFLEIKVAPSPLWMQRRLQAAGVRPINNIVDVSNYVMLELNQPLHAFDLDLLAGKKLIIRRARAGEKLHTLDGVERELMEGMLAIADPSGPVAVAGVMGGASSEVRPETERIFLEGAYFDRISIRRTARILAMRTEASIRMERWIDPASVLRALDRAAYLVEEIGAGKVARGTIDVAARTWAPKQIKASAVKINAVLGTNLQTAEIGAHLDRLGFGVAAAADGELTVTVPTYRQDIEEIVDLAEEVARLHGYDRIPSAYPASQQVGRRTRLQEMAGRARRLLCGLGQHELVTYSLISPRTFDRLHLPKDDPARRALRIMAPLSEDLSVMRPTLLASILDTLAFNDRHGNHDAALFELARVYLPEPGQELPREPLHLAGGLMGDAARKSWNEARRAYDFYDLKGLIEACLEGLGCRGVVFAKGEHSALHPGRTACLQTGTGQILGYMGEVHPLVAEAFELKGTAFLYELDFDALCAQAGEKLEAAAPSRLPAVPRDLAVVVPENVPFHDLAGEIRRLGGELLAAVDLFDVYTGQQVGAGKKSMAFSLVFRSGERTLTDAEVNRVMERITKGIGDKFGAVLR